MTRNRAILTAAGLSLALSIRSDAQRAVPRPGPAPDIVWRVPGMAHGQPAVDERSVYVLSKHHEVLSLDRATGALGWKQATNEPGTTTEGSAVVVSDEVVVVGDYNLVAFGRRTGDFRWRFVPVVGYAPGVYLGESASGIALAGSPAGRLYAVAVSDGELRWTYTFETLARTTVYRPVTDGTIAAIAYTTFDAPSVGGVAVVDLLTGRPRWRTTFPRSSDPLLGTGAAGGPILTAAIVVAASGDGRIHGFARSDGHLLWTLPAIDGIPPILLGPSPPLVSGTGADYRPLAVSGQTLLTGSLKGHVIAYDLPTLREEWRYLDARHGSVSFGLTSDTGAVYVPFYSGRHVALSLGSGGEIWRTSDPADGFNWPAVSDARHVYLAGDKGGYVAISR